MASGSRAVYRRAPKRNKPIIGITENGNDSVEGSIRDLPFGNEGDTVIVDPSDARDGGESSAGDSPSDSTRGRGRPRGPNAKTKAKIDISGIEKILFSMHMLVASGVQVPQLALDENEAKQLAAAVGEVAKYYPIAIDDKTMAWGNLLMVAGTIYGSRALAIYLESQNKTKQVESPNDNVVRGTVFNPMNVQAGKLPS